MNGRQLCEERSLTGRHCVYPVRNFDNWFSKVVKTILDITSLWSFGHIKHCTA